MHVRLKVALAGMVLSTSVVSAQQAVRPAGHRQGANIGSARRGAGRPHPPSMASALDSERKPLQNATSSPPQSGDRTRSSRSPVGRAGRVQLRRAARGSLRRRNRRRSRAASSRSATWLRSSAGEVAGTIVMLPSRLPPLAASSARRHFRLFLRRPASASAIVDPALPKVSPTR